MENMLKLGPTPTLMQESIWDERGKTKIKQILLSYGNNAIYAIQFVYVVDSKMLASEVHGRSGGLNSQTVTFDDPSEYLTSVSGEFVDRGIDRLFSIAFGTNKRKYGPFGGVVKNLFYSYIPFGYNFGPYRSFGGFHGSLFNSSLYTIGVYVKAPESVAETERDTRIKKVKQSEEDDES